MRKLTMAAVAGWPMFAFNPISAIPPPDFVAEERCLAVFNVASAVQFVEDPEDMSSLMVRHELVNDAYDRLERALLSRTGLTEAQKEAGADTFDEELHHWLDLFGDAPDADGQELVAKTLAKRVDLCFPIVPK